MLWRACGGDSPAGVLGNRQPAERHPVYHGSMEIVEALKRARALAARAEDAAAKQAYIDILRADPTNLDALNELGNLAWSGGFRAAARTAYLQAVAQHPENPVARVNLANVLLEAKDAEGAALHYRAALTLHPDLREAHQGMARILKESDPERAEYHWRAGFSGEIVTRPYRGTGVGVPLLLLVSARGGNIPTQLWIDDRHFTVHALYAEFLEPGMALPAHALVMNAIGDADLCDAALTRAGTALRRATPMPVVNQPARVQATGRAENARRLGTIPGVIAPCIQTLSPTQILDADLRFPLLLRRPGFHTGEHFVRVTDREGLAAAVASLAGDPLMVISYLDARGADGLARKYRVMFVDGVLYPLHLAASRDWKVHYFSSEMARDGALRDEERRFLEDMPGVLGARAMQALRRIEFALGLDYAGIDFALAADGSVLLFEANASMVVFPPDPDPQWDYRRRAIDEVLQAAIRMLLGRAARAAPFADLAADLAHLTALDRRRSLQGIAGLDFTSNDYLGLAASSELRAAALDALSRQVPIGAGGSRLLRGNHPEHEALEQAAAAYFGAESALYFGSGFAANVALFATAPQRGDLVVHDEWIHASVRDGLRQGRAQVAVARHNDTQSIDDAVGRWRAAGGTGRVWIAVESIYSMDGDRTDLEELHTLAERVEAILFVDEAHATGVLGPQGRGRAASLEGGDNVVTLHTCGKAIGTAGALICAPRVLTEFLVNRGRAFIFATAPSPLVAAVTRAALLLCQHSDQRRERLRRLVDFAGRALAQHCGLAASGSHILPIIVGEDRAATALAARLRAQGFDVRAIRPPTVPAGTARLRISLTLNADEAAVENLFRTLAAEMAAS